MNNLFLAFSLLATQLTYGATQAPQSSPVEGDVKRAAVPAPVATNVARAGTHLATEADVKVIDQLEARAEQIRESTCPTGEALQRNLEQLVANFATATEPRRQALEIAGVLHHMNTWKGREYVSFANSLYERSKQDTTFNNNSAEAQLLRNQEGESLNSKIRSIMQCLVALPAAAQQLILKIHITYFSKPGDASDSMCNMLTNLLLCGQLKDIDVPNTTGLLKELLPIIASYDSDRYFSAGDFAGLVKGSYRFKLRQIDRLDGLPDIAQSKSIVNLQLDDNAITRITADHLHSMPNLAWLQLCNNRITHFPAAILVQCKKLIFIDISENPIKTLDEYFYEALKVNGVQWLTAPKTLDKATQERLRKAWAAAGKEPHELQLI